LYGGIDVTKSSPLGYAYSLHNVPRHEAYNGTDLMTGLGVVPISGTLRCDL